jgi:hypothetical protein
MSNKRAALQMILDKLAKLIPLLGSDKPGEVFNAAQAMARLLASVRLDLHDLVTFISADEAPLIGILRRLFEKDSDALLRLGQAGASLFRSTERMAFADVMVHGHRMTWPISSSEFAEWLLHQFFAEKKKVPSAAALKSAVHSLTAYAAFEGEQHDVHLRVAEFEEKIYVDLGDQDWRAIEIDSDGWRIISAPPVRFRRTYGMGPLPLPEQGGSIDRLRRFVNLNDNDFILLVAVLLDALRPGKAHPVLYLFGEQGAAKTTLARIVRMLIDPSSTPLRALPGTVRDLFVSVHNGYALSFDNVSRIPAAISDALCQISSGSGFGARKLYTDSGEFSVSGSRPVVLNGLANSITRSDLADRAVILHLAPIKEEGRLSETEFWSAFEAERPKIFGAMLDFVVWGLRAKPRIQLPQLPRMADFVMRSVACEGAFASKGAFLRAFNISVSETTETLIDEDCVAIAVRVFMIGRSTWRGTATQLLRELSDGDRTEEQVSRWASWPRNPALFSTRLRAASAILRKVGTEVSFNRDSSDRRRTRIIELRKVEQHAPPRQPRQRRSDSAEGADGVLSLQREVIASKK